MKKHKRLWSVPRIKHPKYPRYTVRVGEFEPGGTLHVFRWVNGKQTSRALSCRRVDLGATTRAQVAEARRIGCEVIEVLATQPASRATTRQSASAALTIAQLADRYEVDGFAGRTPAYRRDALASIRRIGAFLGADQLVRDVKPSHVQKYLAYRVAQGHAPAGRSDLLALSIACNWAVGEDLLAENPLNAKRARAAMKLDHAVQRPVATAERYATLKAVAPQLPPAFGVLLDLAWHTGHRISAILGLRWQDVCFEATPEAPYGTIRWYAGVLGDRKKHDHALPMNEPTSAALLGWQRRTAGIGAAWVFAAPGRPVDRLAKWGPKTWLKKAEHLAELPHARMGGWHMFRRGWATARKHFPLQDVAAGGGWKDTATVTKCYQHATENDTREAVTYVA